jgi:hypothetical protein
VLPSYYALGIGQQSVIAMKEGDASVSQLE